MERVALSDSVWKCTGLDYAGASVQAVTMSLHAADRPTCTARRAGTELKSLLMDMYDPRPVVVRFNPIPLQLYALFIRALLFFSSFR